MLTVLVWWRSAARIHCLKPPQKFCAENLLRLVAPKALLTSDKTLIFTSNLQYMLLRPQKYTMQFVTPIYPDFLPVFPFFLYPFSPFWS